MQLVLPPLTNRQMEIINGCLLGDGSICKTSSSNCLFSEAHKLSAREYVEKLALELGEWAGRTGEHKNSGGRDVQWQIRSKKHAYFNSLRTLWYPERKKVVPANLRLTPLTLAHWFCGDGTNGYASPIPHGIISIATCGFTLDDVEYLVKRLKIDLDIEAKSYINRGKRGCYPNVLIRACSHKSFIDMLKDHVDCKCFQYKLSYREITKNRSHISWSFISPNGVKYQTIELGVFAKHHGLSRSGLGMVSRGKRKHHKGWTIA